jgi:replication-associated recombination protein RarA
MTFGQRATVGGYRCEEVSSAMQKCIRRGLEEDALFWATELDLSGFGEYVWKRLKIIASEDIGLEEGSIRAVAVRALYDNWREQRKKDDTRHAPERLFLVHAVLALSRSFKSRVVDNALIVFYEGAREKRSIPDFALDRHTQRGRRLHRGWDHFFTEGVGPNIQPDAVYEQRARAIRRDNRLELEG